MDPKDEYLKRSVGIPLDPAKQKDPEEAGADVPAEGRSEYLNDVSGVQGGQRTEAGLPWEGAPELQTEYRKKYDESSNKRKGRR
ncbi:hypothetical protein [Myxococcus sp. RHSTA-1-4]|uniref:hypothetical protein n=1 Tax=Myxococcus sp. RHSTA-1-4 TaxID=2874601 RepID=UPI001CBF5C6C|nr:hypothetical protein [Myxococcus sp. RHSTA-1-4]MBZ4416308.1 hypothetical protein [Myxococcus sp. RHSTA-1-4]